jgi:ketosteroid isomerase-like protein
MNRTLCVVAAIAAVSTGVLAQRGSPPTDDQFFRDLDKRWFDAYFRGDGAALDNLEAADLVIVQPDGSVFNKTTSRALRMPQQSNRTREVTEFRLRMAGDVAVVTGVEVNRVGAKSQQSRFTEILRRINGEWRVWSFAGTPIVTGRK